MKNKQFWNQIDSNFDQSLKLIHGGMPQEFSWVANRLGLSFWLIGLIISFILTILTLFGSYRFLSHFVISLLLL